MASKTNKWATNTPGKYYVDDQCIDCDACRTEAPKNFVRDNENGYSYVIKQPSTPEEEEQARIAMEACPVEAIGCDGNT